MWLVVGGITITQAGIGTILSAREVGKIGDSGTAVPRCRGQGEHRNDHQLDTVAALCDLPGVWVAHDGTSLADGINQALLLGAERADKPSLEAIQLAQFVQRFLSS